MSHSEAIIFLVDADNFEHPLPKISPIGPAIVHKPCTSVPYEVYPPCPLIVRPTF